MTRRREWIVMTLVLVIGIGARAWRPSTIGLNQFDEGVYAISAAGVANSEPAAPTFPRLERFAPPVYYTLVALSYSLQGHASDLAAVMVNIVLGSLTIVAIWFVGRRWFGPGAGVAAATILALNEFHITFSRSGLTDITFLLIYICAVAIIVVAITRQSVAWSILAGLIVGVAWNTKYHGWFAVVTAAGALAPAVWQDRRTPERLYKPVALLALVAIIGALCYLPWAWYVETSAGGYASLAAYQRTLLSKDWFENFYTQTVMQTYFDGPFSRCALPLAIGLAACVLPPERVNRRFLVVLALVSISSLLLGGAATSVALASAAIPELIKRNRYDSWMLLSWLGLFFVSTPLYHPYARLLLPFTVGTHIAAGVYLASVLSGPPGGQLRPITGRVSGAVAAAVLVLGISLLRMPAVAWRPARSFADVARAMSPAIPRGQSVIVIGEPTLGFYLNLAGHSTRFENVERLRQLEDVRDPVSVVTGVYAKRAPALREVLGRLKDRLVTVATYRPVPNDVRLIDDLTPARARLYARQPDDTFDVTLYRLMPAGERSKIGEGPEGPRR